MTMLPRKRGTPDPSRTRWRKSTHSGGNGDCVEIASLGDAMAVRDSKHPTGPSLFVSRDIWRGFIQNVKATAHDL
jgi:hypothetical protein